MRDQPEALRLATYMECSMGCGPIERSAANELRRQHSRIEADEALMRTALYELRKCVDWPCANAATDEAIHALRARLETSNV